jgi:hypothetical protein
VGKLVVSLSAILGLALASASAVSAPTTLRVIAVQTSDIKTYRHELEILQGEFKKEGLPVTLRVWRATYAGPDTGTIIVTLEVPDLGTLARIEDAVMKPNSAGMRKIVSDGIYEEINP